MKKLANLKGVKALNKNEQRTIKGGGPSCSPLELSLGCVNVQRECLCPW